MLSLNLLPSSNVIFSETGHKCPINASLLDPILVNRHRNPQFPFHTFQKPTSKMNNIVLFRPSEEPLSQISKSRLDFGKILTTPFGFSSRFLARAASGAPQEASPDGEIEVSKPNKNLKLAIILVYVVFSSFIGESYPLKVWQSILPIVFGCSLAAVTEVSFNFGGLWGAMISNVGFGGGAQVDQEQDDRYYIRSCVELARTAIGYTSPNPMVGCVIVKDGKIVGEGFHPKAGQPHAEIFALRDAGDLAENGTAYVSLEPCNHYGRTPPCTEALIKARVKKVVIGMVDPNATVDSKGIRKLRDAGIEVTVGVEEELCKKLNEAYIHYMLTGKPFVTLRYSIAVSGHPFDQLGEEVTECGGYYSKLLNPNSQVQTLNPADDATSKVLIFTEKGTNVEPETSQKGIETVVFDRISLISILEHCKHQGLCSVLLDLRGDYANFEGILREGFEQNLLQKLVVEVLPIWRGSEQTALKHIYVEQRVKNLTSMISENETAYVSLEPCNHYERTPLCTEALIKARVKKVVIGMVDPDAIVDSKGIRKLRDAGIEVTVGVEEELCKKLNEAYIYQMLMGKPFVTLRHFSLIATL
ncbi:riboflavin biosynthesis PYRD, chloroplastic [Olea europaea subsp. europaea]|uniref:Riboflavin biosynthesis protein PYRD, chloroplastic n=1 Tax=Olea europaea subsp. europaea TaxID=158383 RepID=A0A8S0SUI9_OLEEU|nr:riboflavin biosynthesis PYRD, chloroplastic [Olea europaea subsp. europaea]